VPTSIFIDIFCAILILLGIICLISAMNRNLLPDKIRGRKSDSDGNTKRMHLIFVGFLLLILSTALLLLT
jgi:hypothetical protein